MPTLVQSCFAGNHVPAGCASSWQGSARQLAVEIQHRSPRWPGTMGPRATGCDPHPIPGKGWSHAQQTATCRLDVGALSNQHCWHWWKQANKSIGSLILVFLHLTTGSSTAAKYLLHFNQVRVRPLRCHPAVTASNSVRLQLTRGKLERRVSDRITHPSAQCRAQQTSAASVAPNKLLLNRPGGPTAVTGFKTDCRTMATTGYSTAVASGAPR
jgi:hypothetical protein